MAVLVEFLMEVAVGIGGVERVRGRVPDSWGMSSKVGMAVQGVSVEKTSYALFPSSCPSPPGRRDVCVFVFKKRKK